MPKCDFNKVAASVFANDFQALTVFKKTPS